MRALKLNAICSLISAPPRVDRHHKSIPAGLLGEIAGFCPTKYLSKLSQVSKSSQMVCDLEGSFKSSGFAEKTEILCLLIRKGNDPQLFKKLYKSYAESSSLSFELLGSIAQKATIYNKLDFLKVIFDSLRPEDLRYVSSSAFSCSTQYGHLDIVRYLLEDQGYNYREHIRDAMGNCASSGHNHVVAYLERYLDDHDLGTQDQDYFVFLMACQGGNRALARKYLDRGLDIHYGGEQALLNAIQSGKLEMVHDLVRMGSSIHKEVYKSFHDAIYHNHPAMVQYLIEEGYKPLEGHLRAAMRMRTCNADIIHMLSRSLGYSTASTYLRGFIRC